MSKGYLKNSLKGAMAFLMVWVASVTHAYDFSADGYFFNILSETDKTVEVTYDYLGCYAGDLVIPGTVVYEGEEYTVEAIGSDAFTICMSLTSVTVPNTVKRVEYGAFNSCFGLISVDLPKNLEYLGGMAFMSCSELQNIVIPDGITAIYDWTFTSCRKLEEIKLPANLISLGENVFYGCSALSSITLPATLEEISLFSLGTCTSMTEINVEEGSKSFASYDGALYDSNLETLYVCPAGKKSVILPESLVSISDYAFFECANLIIVDLPSSVSSIGRQAFGCCYVMQEINVDPNNSSYASYDGVLYDKTYKQLIVCPGGKDEVMIHENTEYISDYAFQNCFYIYYIEFPEGVRSVGEEAFSTCIDLTTVIFGDSLESIGSYAFFNCINLYNIIFGKSLSRIGYYAFYGCTSLEELTFEENLTEIEEGAFTWCEGIKIINCYALEPPVASQYAFDNNAYVHVTLNVTPEAEPLYRETEPWSYFQKIESPLVSGVKRIDSDMPTVTVLNGTIILNDVNYGIPVYVYDASGRIVYNGYDTTINIPVRGIYFVKVGDKSLKVRL